MIDIHDITGWGYLDIESLSNHMDTAKVFDIYPEDIKEQIKELEGDVLEINNWFYGVIYLTYYAYIEKLEEYVKDNYPLIYDRCDIEDKIQESNDNFSPYINCLDSWYSNFLDDNRKDNSTESYKDGLRALLEK